MEHVVTTVGGGDIRFILTYAPEYPWAAFGQMLINTDSLERVPELVPGCRC